MDCNRIQDRLVDYLTEETRITERLCVDVHLATCYHCREAMEDVRVVLDAAQESTRYAGAERSFESAMNEIRTREALLTTSHGRAGQQNRRWSWGIAASALPIVVACITPFIVAWPGGSTGTTSENAPDVTPEAMLETESRFLDLTDPILSGRFDLISPIP